MNRYTQAERTPLFHAIDADSFAGVSLATEGVDIEQSNGSGFTPLQVAALRGASPAVVKLLLHRGADAAATCHGGFTALHVCVLFGNAGLIDVLVRIGDSSLEREDDEGRTALLLAVFFGQVWAVSALVRLGSDVNRRYRDGATPLHCAVRMKHVSVLRALLRGRSDTAVLFNEQTAAQLAVSLGHDDVAEEITDYPRQRALQTAVFRRETDAIRTLLDSEPKVVDRRGEALCVAIAVRSEPWVKALLDHHDSTSGGTSTYVNSANIDSVGWLSNVVGGGHLPSARIVRLLIEAGADTVSPILCKWEGSRPFVQDPIEALSTAIRADSDEEEEHLFRLKRILRLFMHAPAVHANSWSWPSSTGGSVNITGGKPKRVKREIVVRMLPLLRRRGAKRRELLLAVERWVA